MRYRAKPVEMEAIRWTGDNFEEVKAFADEGRAYMITLGGLRIETSEGHVSAPVGHYICKDAKGGVYPCDPEIFEAKYEPVE